MEKNNWLREDDYQEYRKCAAAEPQISQRIRNVFAGYPITLTDWETRVKTKASLYGKLYERGRVRGANDVYDIVRYTVVLPDEEYTELLPQLFHALKEAGFACLRLKNTWDPSRPAGYHAVHYDFCTRDGIKGEIQFHTPESLAAKRASHAAYKSAVPAGCLTAAFPAFGRVPFPKGASYIGAEIQ